MFCFNLISFEVAYSKNMPGCLHSIDIVLWPRSSAFCICTLFLDFTLISRSDKRIPLVSQHFQLATSGLSSLLRHR